MPPLGRLRALRDQLGGAPAAAQQKTVDPTRNVTVPDPLEPLLLLREDEAYVDANP